MARILARTGVLPNLAGGGGGQGRRRDLHCDGKVCTRLTFISSKICQSSCWSMVNVLKTLSACHQRAAITTVDLQLLSMFTIADVKQESRYVTHLSYDGAELVVPGVPGLELGRRVNGVRHQLILALGYSFHLLTGPTFC
jgi:hypothetical protein